MKTSILLSFISSVLPFTASALRCEEPFPGSNGPAYQYDDSRTFNCLTGTCWAPNIPGTPGFNPALAPDSINATNVPYCQTHCVRPNATPAQLALAPACAKFCYSNPAGGPTPEQLGWCMYWCVDGKEEQLRDLTCEPEVAEVFYTTTVSGTPVTGFSFVTATWYTSSTVVSSSPTISAHLNARTTGASTTGTVVPTLSVSSSTRSGSSGNGQQSAAATSASSHNGAQRGAGFGALQSAWLGLSLLAFMVCL